MLSGAVRVARSRLALAHDLEKYKSGWVMGALKWEATNKFAFPGIGVGSLHSAIP